MSLEICRICGSDENLKHVFEEGSEELLDQIRICANIHIDAFDGLPKFVCTDCENGLAFSYRLRKRGEETERKLRQELLVTDGKHENTDVVEENILEDLQNNQSWIEDDEGFCFNESAEGFLATAKDMSVEDVEEVEQVESSDHYDQSEEWISIENAEIIEDSGVERIVNDSIDLVYLNNDVSNNVETTATESTPSKKPKKTQIDCETCGEVFETKTKYGEHIKVHGDKRFHCDVCDKWFNARYRFDQHMKNHCSKKAAYPCDKCSKSFTIHWNLERHIRSVHNGEKRFQCAECGESFGRTDVLKMHMAKHSNERNIECEICQKKFKTLQHLHYHKKIHLEKSERPKKPARLKPKPKCPKIQIFMCEFCDKVSHHRTTHLNHLRTHTGEKPFICATCNKAFRTTHARSKHMLLHTDERPHDCKLCGMSFRQTAHLKSHMLIHAGIKRHVCEFCHKAFTMKNNLMVHMRTHTGEMPYKCNQCPQKFLQLSKAKRHKMSHMSEGSFPEDTCDDTPNEVETDFNDSQISMYIDDIIEINQNDGDSVVISDCVIEEC